MSAVVEASAHANSNEILLSSGRGNVDAITANGKAQDAALEEIHMTGRLIQWMPRLIQAWAQGCSGVGMPGS